MNARRLKGAALVALAYLVAARLSLLLAIPPGYSTIVWPPSGLALAALWLWGIELWPGVLVGSALANAWMAWSRGFASPASLALSAWIGVGASAQAVAAAALARRAVGRRDPLATEGALLPFLLLGGPLACLLSASWATAGLRLFGAIGPGETPFSWATWWIGDSIGVVCAAPLVLLWRPGARARRGRATISAALAATVAVISAVQTYAIGEEERNARAQALQKLADVSLTLRVGMAGHVEALQAAADLFASRADVSRAEFGRFARGILERHPGMQAVEWRPRVTDARRAAVEAAARRDGLAGYSFTGLEDDGRVLPRGRAAEYFPILYAEPLSGNEKALGLDINRQQTAIRDAAERALASGKPAASGGVRLVQETASQTGVAVMVPVRRADDGAPNGLLEGVFRVGDLMESLLAGSRTRALGVRVLDESVPEAPRVLYERGRTPAAGVEEVSLAGDFGGRRWRIELVPDAGFQARERAPLSWFVLFSALLFSYLFGWVALTLGMRAEEPAPPDGA